MAEKRRRKKKKMHQLVIFLLIIVQDVGGQHFVCPTREITVDDGPIGVIPPGRLGLSVIPLNYDCRYNFVIFPGFALHLSISTHYEELLGDIITFTDNLGSVHQISTPNQHIDVWASSPAAVLHIQTVTNASQMFAIYEFLDVERVYKHKILPTGEYFSLGDMRNKYYTFYSKRHDLVALNIAIKNTQDYDSLLDYIFVYDGGDIKNSPMIGRLSYFLKKIKVSTSPNITIVNFFDVKSPSYLIGNDWSKIAVFSKYKAILTSRNQQTTAELFDASDQGAAYTWICSDCKHFFWTVLKFQKSKTNPIKAYIELRSLSPTYDTRTLLNYTVDPNVSQYFPQLIPSRMFTMINHHSGIAVALDTSTSKSTAERWLRPYDGRKGAIFSPSMWDPKTSPAFSFQFENGNQKFMFGVDVKRVLMAASGESLTIKTGPMASENSTFYQFFSNDAEYWRRQEMQGNFLQISFNGTDRKSSAVIAFNMALINSGLRTFVVEPFTFLLLFMFIKQLH